MVMFVASFALLALVAVLIRRAFCQRDAFSGLELVRHSRGEDVPKVCVVVPARNEQANIATCVRSLLAQDTVELSLIVVDDDSNDDTARIVSTLANEDTRARLMHTPPLPPGWKGKVHACHIGAATAPSDTQWLCFIDADVTAVHPAAVASAVNAAVRRRLDLLSLMPRQELRSFAERLVLPCGLYLLAFSEDISKAQQPESNAVAATGQFMLMRRDVYEAVGGHASVCGEICEDTALAKRLKVIGRRVLLLDGSKVFVTRMYSGWGTLWPGVAKNLSEMLGGPVRTAAVAFIALVIAWASIVLPIIDVVQCAGGSALACTAAVPAILALAAAMALHLAGAVHFGIPLWYGFLFPAGYTAGAVIGFDSLRWRLMRRVRWKGRVYS